jgi:hypothetical protein
MRLPTFAYHAPKSFQELVKIKCDFKESALIIAEGEDFVANLENWVISPSSVTAVKNIEDLQRDLVGKILPSPYSHTVIKEYYSGYAQYRRLGHRKYGLKTAWDYEPV